jgi:hypothetical protein
LKLLVDVFYQLLYCYDALLATLRSSATILVSFLFHATIATERRRSVVASLRSLRETALHSEQSVQECDATDAK